MDITGDVVLDHHVFALLIHASRGFATKRAVKFPFGQARLTQALVRDVGKRKGADCFTSTETPVLNHLANQITDGLVTGGRLIRQVVGYGGFGSRCNFKATACGPELNQLDAVRAEIKTNWADRVIEPASKHARPSWAASRYPLFSLSRSSDRDRFDRDSAG